MDTPPIIDSHCHLDFAKYDADRDAVLARAAAAGVDRLITIGCDLASSRRAHGLAQRYAGTVFAAAGVHPHEADAFDDADWPALTALMATPEVVAVGETGLDYYYDKSDRARQRALFRRHLEVSAELGKPVVVHIRDAFDDAWVCFEDVGTPAGGVVHCFTGGPAECGRALELGLYVSISGIATFPNARDLREAVTLIPPDRLLVETDAPFLAPVPLRGKRNEPAFVVHTARAIAALRGEDFGALAAQTRANTVALFGLPA